MYLIFRTTLVDNILKYTMRKLLFVAVIALLSPVVAMAQVDVDKIPSVNININCDTLVTPDVFTVSLSITSDMAKGKKGVEDIEKNVLVKTLKNIGVDIKKDLVISNFYSTNDKKGNSVWCKNYTLTLNSVTMLNTVLDKLTDESIVVGRVESKVSNENEIINILRVKAIAMSKRDAELMLSAANCNVGRLLKLSYNARISGDTGEMMNSDNFLVTGYVTRKAVNSYESVDTYKKKNISTYITVTYEIVNH